METQLVALEAITNRKTAKSARTPKCNLKTVDSTRSSRSLKLSKKISKKSQGTAESPPSILKSETTAAPSKRMRTTITTWKTTTATAAETTPSNSAAATSSTKTATTATTKKTTASTT